MTKVMEVLKKIYLNRTVYRLVWTGVQVGAGIVAAKWASSPELGVVVTLVTTVLTSEARERIAERKNPPFPG
jgi:uncharacterized membrane protein YdcZ (DUF606 family)